ncbi:MAG: acyl carrier protein [Candidatus Sumerlaeota bacterium]|nr:acyl carrier protein [Candidatus Sumerlaeota bacterium]
MNTMEILNGIFQRVFENDEIQIRPEMTANDIEGWDSLSHVNLILAVEAKFKIRFTQKELLTMKNIGDLHKDIEAKIPR